MTLVLIFYFSLLNSALAVNQTNTRITQFEVDTRIIGGQTVKRREDFPYQASLRLRKRPICGGSIITSQYILTAAHCCVNKTTNQPHDPQHYTVVVGDLNVYKPTKHTIEKHVVETKHHEGFVRNGSAENDVAVLKLTQSFTQWNPFIRPIELAQTPPRPGTLCVVSGWGRLEGTTPGPSAELQMLHMPIVSRSECVKVYHSGAIKDGMFCAGYMEGAHSSCKGDSGGPLVCHGVLYGIVSWGQRMCKPGKPRVYADVAYYRKWILEKIAEPSMDSSALNCKSTSRVVLLYNIVIFYYYL